MLGNREPANKERFRIELRNRFAALEGMEEDEGVNAIWDGFKSVFNETAEATIGKRKKEVKEWMTDDTWRTIEERKTVKIKMTSSKSTRIAGRFREEYQRLDREVKQKCRRDKREFINGLISEAEEAARKGEQGTVYRITKKISGKFKSGSSVIRDKNGNILTKERGIQERWKEHFEEVLNREPPIRPARIERGRVNEEIGCEEISEEEIRSMLKKVKNNKAPGFDNITGEMLKADIEVSTKWLKKLFDKIWTEEETPGEWSRGILTTVPKKGDLSKCSNWRGITLLSVPSKILGNILIERNRKAIDKELRKEQAGFRKGKGTSDQIFILRNIIEQSVEWQAPLYLNFIDFEKAFDSIHRDTLWKIMELYGVPSKISTVIKRLYQNNEICVTNNGLQSDWVRIESGVKQGCGMSGFLFLLVLDWVMRNSVQGKNTGIRWKFMSKLEDLDFADDIALISSKFNDIQDKTTAVKEWAEKAGLKINIGKTKSMRLNTKIDRPLRIDGKELEDVDQFTYLGSKVTKEGGASEDIKSRLQKARSAFLSLNQVWKSSLYSVKTKLKIYNSNVKSVLMYGSECWKMTVADIKKCEAFNNRCLRRIIRVFWPNKISNIELRERTKTQTIEESIRLRRWRCIGHVLRKGNEEDQKVAMSWTPEGKRRRGRSRETWRRTAERERNLFGWSSWRTAEDVARDRPRWRDLCLALCSTRSEEDR